MATAKLKRKPRLSKIEYYNYHDSEPSSECRQATLSAEAEACLVVSGERHKS
jgi:hypothetical protein